MIYTISVQGIACIFQGLASLRVGNKVTELQVQYNHDMQWLPCKFPDAELFQHAFQCHFADAGEPCKADIQKLKHVLQIHCLQCKKTW